MIKKNSEISDTKLFLKTNRPSQIAKISQDSPLKRPRKDNKTKASPFPESKRFNKLKKQEMGSNRSSQLFLENNEYHKMGRSGFRLKRIPIHVLYIVIQPILHL